MFERRKKSRDGSGQNPDDEPTVHITETGGWYVDPGELLRSEPVRKEIEKWSEYAEKIGIAETERGADKKSAT